MQTAVNAELLDGLAFGLTTCRLPAFLRPDSSILVFVRSVVDSSADGHRGSLHALDITAGAEWTLSTEEQDVRHFAVKHDGSEIAVCDGRTKSLLVADVSASDPSALSWTTSVGIDFDAGPTWSPTHRRLALTLRPTGDAEQSIAEVVTGRFYKEDTYGFVGQSRRQVSVVDLERNEVEWTSEHEHGASMPTWSPDGQRLAVRLGSADGFVWGTIAILDQAHGGVLSTLESWQGTVEAMAFYGADSVVFVGSEGPWTQQTDVYVWNWRTAELRTLSRDLPWQIWVYGFHVSPSPLSYLDEHSLLLAGVAHGSSGLYSFDLRSGNWQQLHASDGVRGGLAYSSQLQTVVQEMSQASATGGLSAVCLPLGSERVLVSSNEDFFEKYGDVVVDRYSIPSAGEQLDAWLLYQAGTSLSSAPLVLDIHGGPHNFYGEFFLAEHQLLARHGFAVLYCNPRGSGSYSRRFAAATLDGQWGTADTADLMNVLQSVREQLGHQGQVAVSGWSYGGYQVLTLLQRYPELFAAGVCGAPASDFLSWYGTSDAGPTFAAGELGGLPAERVELYANGSPSHQLDAVRAPLLLLHGSQDMRSPIAQTEIVHRILSDAGKAVRYVRYPGASHGFRNTGRPSQRRHVLQELTCWLTMNLRVPAVEKHHAP